MSNNLINYNRKRKIKKAINKIITKIFDIILFPLRYFYQHKYNGSDFQEKRRVNKVYKKLKNNIYNSLTYSDNIYITDFYVGSDNSCANIISLGDNVIIPFFAKVGEEFHKVLKVLNAKGFMFLILETSS